MWILTVLAGLVSVGSGYALLRTRSELAATRRRLDGHTGTLEVAHDDLAAARQDNDRLIRERDDALERTRRASRDASEVANRLNEANRALSDAQAKGVLDVELLWGLTLAGVDRTWRISVAAGTEAASPLIDCRSLLRTTLEIEVAAAREQAGTLIDFEYSGDTTVDAGAAVLTVAVVRELIASAAADAEEARLSVTVGDAVEIAVAAEDEAGRPVPVRGPLDLEEQPGVFLVPRSPIATSGAG